MINKELSPELRTGTTGREGFENNVQDLADFVEVHDVNPGPVLQDSILEMVDIAGKLHQDIDESTIYYFFNTEAGKFPKSANFKKTADKNIKTWGKITVRFN